jgi:hypothetical protein
LKKLTKPEIIYGIEKTLEPAITKCLEDKFAAFSMQDPQTFQKERARFEVQVNLGAGKGHWAMSETTGLQIDVEDAWDINILIAVLTEAGADAHNACLVFARGVMAQLPVFVNQLYITNHVIYEHMRHAGSAVLVQPQKDVYVTRLNYNTAISVHADAWALAVEEVAE